MSQFFKLAVMKVVITEAKGCFLVKLKINVLIFIFERQEGNMCFKYWKIKKSLPLKCFLDDMLSDVKKC